MAHTFFAHTGSFTTEYATEIAQRFWIEDTEGEVIDSFERGANNEVVLVIGEHAFCIGNEFETVTKLDEDGIEYDDLECIGYTYSTYLYDEGEDDWEIDDTDGSDDWRDAKAAIEKWIAEVAK